MLSIITVVNKYSVFENGLQRSLAEQTFQDYELIVVENERFEFLSMIDALEYGISQSKGDWYLFVHPDIDFMDRNTLGEFYFNVINTKNKDPATTIFGVAGRTKGEFSKSVSNIIHGKNKITISNELLTHNCIEVQTIDACCFMINKEDLKAIGFCHKLSGFHMYVEELCIHANKLKRKVVVIPIRLWHFSAGDSLDYNYYKAAKQVIKSYPELDFFNTTCFQWKVSIFLQVRLSFYAYRNYIHHKLADRLKNEGGRG